MTSVFKLGHHTLNLSPTTSQKERVRNFHQTCWETFSASCLPDRPFHNFRASGSGDRRIISSSLTSFGGFWSSEVVKRSVGFLQDSLQTFLQLFFISGLCVRTSKLDRTFHNFRVTKKPFLASLDLIEFDNCRWTKEGKVPSGSFFFAWCNCVASKTFTGTTKLLLRQLSKIGISNSSQIWLKSC